MDLPISRSFSLLSYLFTYMSVCLSVYLLIYLRGIKCLISIAWISFCWQKCHRKNGIKYLQMLSCVYDIVTEEEKHVEA